MKNLIQMFFVVGFLMSLAGCATEVVKAPCDYQGHFCGQKVKINLW
jgi:hypothetical protein